MEVIEFEPGRRLTIRGSLSSFPAQISYTLRPVGKATTLTNTVDLQPPRPLNLLAPIATHSGPTRMPGLPRLQWVMAILRAGAGRVVARDRTWAVDILAQGGDTLAGVKNGSIQAIVVGPLIGLSQATPLRDHARRWMWCLPPTLMTYLLEAAVYEIGKRVLGVFSVSTQLTARARRWDS